MIKRIPKKDYKWIILGCCILMTFVCLGFCSGNKGLYLTAISDALGIKRSLLSVNDSLRFATTAVINLFFGSVIHRFGARRMIAFGFSALIASTIIYACADHVVMFYVAGVLLGVGLAFASTTMAGSLVRRWFKKDIGKYTGIVFAANGIGGALAAQIVSPMINEAGNPFGYRKSYFLIAGILVVVGILVVALLREHPKDQPAESDVPQKKKPRGETWQGIDFQTAKRQPYFYLACGCVLLTGFMLQGISGISPAHMKDVGLGADVIATIVSVSSLALTVSKVVVGTLYDRLGLSKVMLLCQGAAVAAFVIMAVLDQSSVGVVLGFVKAPLYAFALPLETVAIPLIANELFGSASYDKMLGILSAMNYTGYALGIPVTNLCYDIFGSYRPVLWLFSGLMIPICIIFRCIIRRAQKERNRLSGCSENGSAA